MYIIAMIPGFVQFPCYIKEGKPFRENTDKVIETNDYQFVYYTEDALSFDELLEKYEKLKHSIGVE